MTDSKYHTRQGYERLYGWLLRDTGTDGLDSKDMTNKELLMSINFILRLNHCEAFSFNETNKILQQLNQ